MRRLTHRRTLRTPVVADRGPFARVERVPLLAWVFAAIGLVWLVVELRPLLEWGSFDPNRRGDDAMRVVGALGDAALVALPAGLLVGFPGVRRRNPWLFRGLLLLALAQLARPAIDLFEQVVLLPLLDPAGAGLDPAGAVSTMLSLAIGLLSVGAAWALSDGLADAGAQPRRGVLLLVVGAAVGIEILQVAYYLVFAGAQLDLVRQLPQVAIALAIVGLWFAVGTRLVVGAAAGLVPRRAWILGGIAGALLLAERTGYLALGVIGVAGGAGVVGDLLSGVIVALHVAVSASWVLLLIAFALGLGRGRPLPGRGFRLG